jgi:hypothetical protein
MPKSRKLLQSKNDKREDQKFKKGQLLEPIHSTVEQYGKNGR